MVEEFQITFALHVPQPSHERSIKFRHAAADDVQNSLNGKTISIGTVGQAYRLITNLSSVEWMEFKSLHEDAVSRLQSAAGNAMLTVQATNALRALFVRAKLL